MNEAKSTRARLAPEKRHLNRLPCLLLIQNSTLQKVETMENESLGTVLELGRRLLGVCLPDDETLNRVQRWYSVEYGNAIPFNELLNDGTLSTLLKHAISGHKALLNCLPNDDGATTYSVAVPTVARRGKTRFNAEELEALRAYLALRIEGIGEEPDWQQLQPVSPLWEMIHWIEESPLTRHPIDSEEFRKSILFAIPPEIIQGVAGQAGLPLADAKRLSFRELVVEAARAKPDDFVDSDYAEPQLKSDLASLFGVNRATISRRLESGELRQLPGTLKTAKKVRVHGDDFPPGLKRPNERKLKLSILPKRGKRQ